MTSDISVAMSTVDQKETLQQHELQRLDDKQSQEVQEVQEAAKAQDVQDVQELHAVQEVQELQEPQDTREQEPQKDHQDMRPPEPREHQELQRPQHPNGLVTENHNAVSVIADETDEEDIPDEEYLSLKVPIRREKYKKEGFVCKKIIFARPSDSMIVSTKNIISPSRKRARTCKYSPKTMTRFMSQNRDDDDDDDDDDHEFTNQSLKFEEMIDEDDGDYMPSENNNAAKSIDESEHDSNTETKLDDTQNNVVDGDETDETDETDEDENVEGDEDDEDEDLLVAGRL